MYREPLHRVMEWPASHVQLLARYLAKQPSPEERLEYGIAQLSAMYANAHSKPGSARASLSDFLLFANAWSQDLRGRYSEEELKTIETLHGGKIR